MGKILGSPTSPRLLLHKNLLKLRIHISNRQKDLSICRRSIKVALQELLTYLGVDCEEVSLFLVSKKEISALHKRFFQDPTPTDCISLPLDAAYLGDIFVCPAVAIEYAANKKLDPYEETLLYMIHSTLHLIGYDDLVPNKKRAMRKKEKQCMDHLKSLNIILHA